MASSLLAAVHNAVVSADHDALDEGHTGATALNPSTRGTAMSKDNQPAGISQADHDGAVSVATTAGKTEGEKAATERFNAALGADGVKGDAGRMAAALDLAVKSPAMAGADVAAFIVANVAATTAAGSRTEAYASNRMASAGLAQPGADAPSKKASIDSGSIYAARRKQPQEG